MASHDLSAPVRNNGRNWLVQELQSGPVRSGRVRQCAWQARGRRFESAMLHPRVLNSMLAVIGRECQS
jgi:hypothetical protein